MQKPNTELCPQGLTAIFDELIKEMTGEPCKLSPEPDPSRVLLPKLDDEQRELLIKCTINGVIKACGGEDIEDHRKPLNFKVDINNQEQVRNLMNAFRAVLVAEFALNPELNPNNESKELIDALEKIKKSPELSNKFQDLLDNPDPAFKLLFSKNAEKDEKDENQSEEKKALKALFKLVLIATAIANKQELNPNDIEEKAEKMVNSYLAKSSSQAKSGDLQQEATDVLAKDKQAADELIQLGNTLATVLGTNPFMPGSVLVVTQQPVSLSGMGIIDVNQGGGDALNAAAKQNTEDFGLDPAQTKATTLMNAISAGAVIDTDAENELVNSALKETIPSPKNRH